MLQSRIYTVLCMQLVGSQYRYQEVPQSSHCKKVETGISRQSEYQIAALVRCRQQESGPRERITDHVIRLLKLGAFINLHVLVRTGEYLRNDTQNLQIVNYKILTNNDRNSKLQSSFFVFSFVSNIHVWSLRTWAQVFRSCRKICVSQRSTAQCNGADR